MAPAALAAILQRGRADGFSATAETGSGGSTIVLSQVSQQHVCFAIEGENQTLTHLREHSELRGDRVVFVEGFSTDTLPGYRFKAPLDLVLLDGPHAYPQPQIEYFHLFPHLKPGGWLVLDDLQIPSVHDLYQFLRRESTVRLDEVVGRTAFFRKTEHASAMGPDGWWLQGINRRLVWRYSWRDRLRRLIRRR
jgi:hypothetical protein